jgi:hypothetical protein
MQVSLIIFSLFQSKLTISHCHFEAFNSYVELSMVMFNGVWVHILLLLSIQSIALMQMLTSTVIIYFIKIIIIMMMIMMIMIIMIIMMMMMMVVFIIIIVIIIRMVKINNLNLISGHVFTIQALDNNIINNNNNHNNQLNIPGLFRMQFHTQMQMQTQIHVVLIITIFNRIMMIYFQTKEIC